MTEKPPQDRIPHGQRQGVLLEPPRILLYGAGRRHRGGARLGRFEERGRAACRILRGGVYDRRTVRVAAGQGRPADAITFGYTRRPKPGALGRSGPGCEPPDSMSASGGGCGRCCGSWLLVEPGSRLPGSRSWCPGGRCTEPMHVCRNNPGTPYLPMPGTLLDGRCPGLAGYLRYAARSCVR